MARKIGLYVGITLAMAGSLGGYYMSGANDHTQPIDAVPENAAVSEHTAVSGSTAVGAGESESTATASASHIDAAHADSLHDFTVTSIDRLDMPLSQFEGKAVLLVNTATFCGYTPQYEGLQALWNAYKDEGLVVLGVPSNDFGSQEPEGEDKIKRFCSVNYQVDFPMTKKMVVNGSEGTAELYAWLASTLGDASRPQWNFHKYLIDPSGKPVAFFPSKVEPESPELVAAIKKVLPHS